MRLWGLWWGLPGRDGDLEWVGLLAGQYGEKEKPLRLTGQRGFLGAVLGLTPIFLFLQPSCPGSAMASWLQASGLSPSCKVTWDGKLPMVSADPFKGLRVLWARI